MSRVYVGTLDPNVTKEQLEDEARQFGKVEDIWIARNPPGFAFITYEDLRDAEDAVRGMAGKRIGEQEVRVEIAKNRGGGSAGPRGNYGGDGGGYGGREPDLRPGETVRPGDWTCPECGANVFAMKSACFRCNTPKPNYGGGDRGGDRYGDRGGDRYGDRGRDRSRSRSRSRDRRDRRKRRDDDSESDDRRSKKKSSKYDDDSDDERRSKKKKKSSKRDKKYSDDDSASEDDRKKSSKRRDDSASRD
mmetsp:Transcript_36544/g.92613  ORF Transcript_36544/g.92613 Transcript_36544/m.92613 type:complete len:247 (+) Transcript_36544:78-818(+)